jgi:hypothetical protein
VSPTAQPPAVTVDEQLLAATAHATPASATAEQMRIQRII